jgi:hypothetical protein
MVLRLQVKTRKNMFSVGPFYRDTRLVPVAANFSFGREDREIYHQIKNGWFIKNC